VLAQLS